MNNPEKNSVDTVELLQDRNILCCMWAMVVSALFILVLCYCSIEELSLRGLKGRGNLKPTKD